MKTAAIAAAAALVLCGCQPTPQDPGRSGKQSIPGTFPSAPGSRAGAAALPEAGRLPSVRPLRGRREPVTRWM